jgi:hypothetical protein
MGYYPLAANATNSFRPEGVKQLRLNEIKY